MTATLAAKRSAGPTGPELADNLIRVTDRLSTLMETEIELLRGKRARDIKALQSDKETLTGVYQRMMSDLRSVPDALHGLDDGRMHALKRSAYRLEKAATGNAIALRTAIEANHRLMEAIAEGIREHAADAAPYTAAGRLDHAGDRPLTVSLNQTL